MNQHGARVLVVRVLGALALACSLTGCFVQGGATAGAALHEHSKDAATWGGQMVAGIEPLHVAAELDGRAEHGRGSSFSFGLQGFETTGDDSSTVRLSFHADLGLGIGWSAPSALYAGGGVDLPIRLQAPLPISERNRNYRVLGSSPWLVPFLRYRFYELGHARGIREANDDVQDLSVGLALRVSYSSDWY